MLSRRTGDPDRAEDLAQEVFLRAMEAPPRNPRPWLFAVALNLVRDDGRREERQARRLQLLRSEQEGCSIADKEVKCEFFMEVQLSSLRQRTEAKST